MSQPNPRHISKREAQYRIDATATSAVKLKAQGLSILSKKRLQDLIKIKLQHFNELDGPVNKQYRDPSVSQYPSATATGTWIHDADFFNLKEYRVKASIGKQQVEALADTGAQSNFISSRFIKRFGLVPDDKIPTEIRLPGGKQILSPGTVKVPFSFYGEVEKYLLDCLVVPGGTNDLILSRPFLCATKSLTTFKNRIKETVRQVQTGYFRLNLLGNESQRLWGSLNDRLALALPDTGSDVMLVSAEFAKENEFMIDHHPQTQLELELADGSRVFTTGVVHDATWHFGDSEQSVSCDLYILNGLSADVVLSNGLIFGVDVFSKFNHLMFDLDPTPVHPEFYNVRLIGKFSDELNRLEKESIDDTSSPYARKAERVRRDQIRDAINALDAAQQSRAWETELQRRMIWDRLHEQQSHRADIADTGQTLPQANNQDSSNSKSCWWKKMFLLM